MKKALLIIFIITISTTSFSQDLATPIEELQPILLVDIFSAKRNKNIVEITWKTSGNRKIKDFILQKNSGKGWVDLKHVRANRITNGNAYSVQDPNHSKNSTLYRIKVVDASNTIAEVSDLRVVKGIGARAEYTVFPNPGRGNGKISIAGISGPTEVSIIDKYGNVIKSETLESKNSLDLQNVQSGVYQIKIKPKSENFSVVRRFTVVK